MYVCTKRRGGERRMIGNRKKRENEEGNTKKRERKEKRKSRGHYQNFRNMRAKRRISHI